jgi:hypothetical protein
MIPNGVVTIQAQNTDRMQDFVTSFKKNRDLYVFLIKALSPKAYIQQGGGYSINLQDITKLPINLDSNGCIILFRLLICRKKYLLKKQN